MSSEHKVKGKCTRQGDRQRVQSKVQAQTAEEKWAKDKERAQDKGHMA